jgi:hypothetical protein
MWGIAYPLSNRHLGSKKPLRCYDKQQHANKLNADADCRKEFSAYGGSMRIYRIAVILLVATVVYMFRLLFVTAAAALYVYFMPSLVAEKRTPLKVQPIFILNLAAGWMVLPWIVALVMAYKMDVSPESTV